MASLARAQDDRVDTDGDGLSDALEQTLLERFAPTFMISNEDCSAMPASMVSGSKGPTVAADDGTIYGQAFRKGTGVELHFYHLWREDCGRMGHPLDDEHVSVLLRPGVDGADDASGYVATYWYAAAHEDTVCDASQVTRAETIDAVLHGPTVWVSDGKHATFLAEKLCTHGCGGDRCKAMTMLVSRGVVNMGELHAPMHGAAWTSSALWPGSLALKMSRSDFPAERIERVDALPSSDIAWASPGQRPAQAVILGGNSTIDALALGNRKTDTALVIAGGHTGGALGKSYDATRHAVSKSFRKTGEFLSGGTKKRTQKPGLQNSKTSTGDRDKIQ